MIRVSHLVPTNVASEKATFFSQPDYNPQFTYADQIPESALAEWGTPDPHIVAFSRQIVENRPDKKNQRQVFSNAAIADECQAILTEIGVTDDVKIAFDPHKVSRCSVRGTHLTFKDPAKFSSIEDLHGTLNHELQTHLLRNLNQRKQDWTVDRDTYGRKLLLTEEGLAVLHSLLAYQAPLIWRPAAYYLAVAEGLSHTFREVFEYFKELEFADEYAWNYALRVKRGLVDTSKPLANTKDICYLEGAIKMWNWINNPDNPVQDLYIGKIFVEELTDRKNQQIDHTIYLPTFMKDLAEYRQNIFKIGQYNHFEELVTKEPV